MTYEIAECKYYPGEWIAEAIDYESEGECYMVRFTGPRAEARAKAYVGWISIATPVTVREPGT